jgi:hypothetical protein
LKVLLAAVESRNVHYCRDSGPFYVDWCGGKGLLGTTRATKRVLSSLQEGKPGSRLIGDHMGIAVTVFPIVLQFVAAIVALRIAIASRRLALLPLALAILLMGMRWSYSLCNNLAFGQPIDLGAEIIALVISMLMLFGLEQFTFLCT